MLKKFTSIALCLALLFSVSGLALAAGESISFSGSDSVTFAVGTEFSFGVTASPTSLLSSLVWSPSSSSVIDYTYSGGSVIGTCKGAGTVTITATSGGASATKTINVSGTSTVPTTGVTVSAPQSLYLGYNQSYSVSASVSPSNATNQSLTWATSDSAVAYLSSYSGSNVTVYTTGRQGSATIRVTTVNGHYDDFYVYVGYDQNNNSGLTYTAYGYYHNGTYYTYGSGPYPYLNSSYYYNNSNLSGVTYASTGYYYNGTFYTYGSGPYPYLTYNSYYNNNNVSGVTYATNGYYYGGTFYTYGSGPYPYLTYNNYSNYGYYDYGHQISSASMSANTGWVQGTVALNGLSGTINFNAPAGTDLSNVLVEIQAPTNATVLPFRSGYCNLSTGMVFSVVSPGGQTASYTVKATAPAAAKPASDVPYATVKIDDSKAVDYLPYVVTASSLNRRRGPGTGNAKIPPTLKAGDVVRVVEIISGWARCVDGDGNTFYASTGGGAFMRPQ